jgi:hypothetical protein
LTQSFSDESTCFTENFVNGWIPNSSQKSKRSDIFEELMRDSIISEESIIVQQEMGTATSTTTVIITPEMRKALQREERDARFLFAPLADKLFNIDSNQTGETPLKTNYQQQNSQPNDMEHPTNFYSTIMPKSGVHSQNQNSQICTILTPHFEEASTHHNENSTFCSGMNIGDNLDHRPTFYTQGPWNSNYANLDPSNSKKHFRHTNEVSARATPKFHNSEHFGIPS